MRHLSNNQIDQSLRTIFSGLTFALVMFACSPGGREASLPRIAIAGLAIESSTFSPAMTSEEAFHARTGDAILDSYPFLSRDSSNYQRAHWFPVLIGRSLPGGIVTREAYESLTNKILEGLKKDLPTMVSSSTSTVR
jgi:hypothetical protein